MLSATLRFGACELRLGSREIYFCRQYSPITPRAFEVLLYLIEHRERVVSKDELLDAIWRTKFVSESVLARMVMKIRRAIGDTGHPRQLIRTVHRIGYRFIGTLDTVVAQPSAPWPEINSPGRRPRLALLPFRNATGIAEFAWVEWGLVTVLIDALERAERFSVVAMRDSILALGTLFESAPDEQRSLAVLRAGFVVMTPLATFAYQRTKVSLPRKAPRRRLSVLAISASLGSSWGESR